MLQYTMSEEWLTVCWEIIMLTVIQNNNVLKPQVLNKFSAFYNAGDYGGWVNKMEICVNFEWTPFKYLQISEGWWNWSFVLP